ncbi:ribonuclease H-like domain-containing protein [Lentinula guzmanii]|uniref:Ribonuclease H-like domain-containing protein n=1 Tax=Lentinula guzmanii TaxID=2804957 RepID=A0AA38JC01_9AGAR|nr:ribonuclease H-like domain-containing protein [Lentinula guzmanii]
MGKMKGEMWQYFWQGPKANSSQFRAVCLGCIRNQLGNGNTQLDDEAMVGLQDDTEFQNAVGSVLGEKKAMIAHILGGEKPCHFASPAAKAKANELRRKFQNHKWEREAGVEVIEDTSSPQPSKKRKAVDRVETIQTKPKVFKGISIPFNDEEKKAIHKQFLRATISANLPFPWVEDPEVIKLFLMFRSAAGNVIPSREVVGGRLLSEEYERVEQELETELKGKKVTLTCDGVKDISKNNLMGVSISSGFKPRLIDLYDATADKKDGDSIEAALGAMVDKAEKKYGCIVTGLGTDNDGGTKAGRVKLGTHRPWILTFPCGAHQGHLCLADYFKVNPDAEKISEQATELIGWINNHGRVRAIFNNIQNEQNKQVKSYLIANATRWTTHLVAFLRLIELKQPLRTAAVMKRDDIIRAHIEVIESGDFWRQLAGVVEDFEPIAYVTNICQSDRARPDIVLLAFVGMYLYFKNLPPARANVSKGMMERLERRCAGFNQPLMITALILNPYERLDSFGPDASANIINVNVMITELFGKITSHPSPEELDPEQIEEWEHGLLHRSQEFSAAFLHYCSSTGPFKDWDQLKADFEKIHNDDPIIFWESMKADREVCELADFALTVLQTVLNTSGNERQFSKVKIRKDRLRNRLQLRKLEQSIKIIENLREHHQNDGLKVLRYGEVLQENDANSPWSTLITNHRKWRAEMVQWKEDAQRHDENFGNDLEAGPLPLPETGQRSRSWLPRSLALLFGHSAIETQILEGGQPQCARRGAYSEEQLLMELLAQEKEDEILDDGALEGSGDEYNGH